MIIIKKPYFIFKPDHDCKVLNKVIVLDSNNALKIAVNYYLPAKLALWFTCPHCQSTGTITDQSINESFLKSGVKYEQH